MPHKIIFLIFLELLLSLNSNAGEVYKWVDETGRTHFGDTIPERYQDKSKKIDVTASKLTDAQRKEGMDRATKEKMALKNDSETNQETVIHTPLEGLKKKPAPASTTCREKMQAWRESAACFDKYRNQNGSVKPEAYRNCTDVKKPAEICE